MKKNIAIIIQSLAGGGAERVASNLSMYLSEDKYIVHTIVYDDTVQDYPYKGILINLNTKVARTPLGKFFNFIKRLIRLRKIKKHYNIDTTISLLGSANLLNVLSRQNDKVILSVRNYISLSKGLYSNLNKLIIRLVYNKADSIIAVSKVIKRDLENNYGLNEKKLKVIYNPYDIDQIIKLSEEEIEGKYKKIFNNPTIITVGSLTDQKGHWHLIRAFKKVKEQVPSANLVILGQGELESYLKKLAFNLGLESEVHFLGFKKNPFKYIASSSLYVFPSLYEGFPNALCEAMACSVPVISTDCKSGPREILAPKTNINTEIKNMEFEENGVLVPVLDGVQYQYEDDLTKEEEILCLTIIKCINNSDIKKKYSEKSLSSVKRFNKKDIIKEWEFII